MAGIEDLIDIFRGESVPLNPFKGRSSSLYNTFGKSRMGKYATTSAAEAANYATKKFPNVIKTTKITPSELQVGKRVYHELEPHYTDDGVKTKRVRKHLKKVTENLNRNYNILSKKNKAKLKIDILKTIASNAKALTPLALKGLSVAMSLPAQVVVMTLAPTKANADEVNMQLEDFAKLAEEAQPKKEMMAAGGIAGMLGEPRSGYQGGGATSTNALVKELYDAAGGFDGTGKSFSEFMADVLFEGDYLSRAEGGRIGLAGGGDPKSLLLSWLIKQAPKFLNSPGKAADAYLKFLKDVKTKTLKGDYTKALDAGIISGVAALLGNQYKKWAYGTESGSFGKSEYPRYSAGNLYGQNDEYWEQLAKEKLEGIKMGEMDKISLKEFKDKGGEKLWEGDSGWIHDYADKYATHKAQGGRIGLADGMTPSESWMRDYFYSGKGGYDDTGMTFDFFQKNIGPELWYKHIGRAKGGRIGYDGGGPINLQALIELYMSEGMTHDEAVAAANKPLPFHILTDDKAQGGRIGFKDGSDWKPPAEDENILESTWKNMGPWQKFFWSMGLLPGMKEGGRIGFKDGEGIMSRVGDMVDMRNVPYYAGEGLKGLVNSAETLSKFPFAAGELGSKLIQQKPNKEMFMKAIEDITPGSWSENVGLTELVEGMGEKRPDDAKTVGGILGLGTEIAVPTGGAFKAGQLLLSKASKAMGKVKDGKTLNKLVEDKISDSGQSRRDFMSMVGTGGLMAGLKWLGLGGLLKGTTKVKPSNDVVMKLRTWIDDSDVDTEWGPVAQGQWAGAFDVESLSKAAQKTMEKLMFPGTKGTPRDRIGWSKHRSGHNEGIYESIPTHEASYILDALKKAGHKVKFEHIDDMGGYSVDDILNKFKNDPMYKGTKEGAEKYKKFKEKTDKWSARKKAEYHSDITDDYGDHYDEGVADFFDSYFEDDIAGHVIKKAEGGRIGLGTGGPPISGEELKQMKKEVSGSGIMDFLKITGSGGMGSNKNIYDQGQQIPGLDQKQYNYGFGVDANVPFNLPGGGQLELQGGTGFGRGRTETTYKGEPVPGMSGMGESKLGDQWNIGAKITYPFANGGLTKTVPPKRGPMPQGLPSALYNGIMRPRSY